MATKKKASAAPSTLVTSEPAAPAGGTVNVGGEAVTFAFPAWALAEMQAPVDVPLKLRRAGTFEATWIKLRVSGVVSIVGVPDAVFAAVRARPPGAPTTVDVELEAGALLLANIRLSGATLSELVANALALWTSISDPATAVKVVVRARAISPHSLRPETLQALRDHIRSYGVAALAPVVREGDAGDDVMLATVLDDDAALRRLQDSAKDDVSILSEMVGAIAEPARAASLIRAISEDHATTLHAPAMLRAVRRHGLALAEIALEHVESAIANPDSGDPERATWLAVLACYPSLRAARLALPLLGSKSSRGRLEATYACMKEHALTALGEAADGKGKQAKLAAELRASMA